MPLRCVKAVLYAHRRRYFGAALGIESCTKENGTWHIVHVHYSGMPVSGELKGGHQSVEADVESAVEVRYPADVQETIAARVERRKFLHEEARTRLQ